MRKALFGNGGHSREVQAQMGLKLPCFVDDDFVTGDSLPFSKFDPQEFAVMIAVADSNDRENIVKKFPPETVFFSWIHPTAIICENVEIGEGSFVGAYSILTTNIKIGNHAILNRANHIGHDCNIGNFFSMMPGSIVSGNVRICDFVYLGTNSAIREKIRIDSNIKIGMGAMVVDNLLVSGTYVGVPAKRIK